MHLCLFIAVVMLITVSAGSERRHQRRIRQSQEAHPVLVTRPRSKTGLSKGTVVLLCNATGSPRPKIVWYRDSERVSRNRYEIRSLEQNGGTTSVIWIGNARKRRDSARFSCVASNRIGSVEAAAQVTLLDENEKPSGFPHIHTNPVVESVEKTRAVTMVCGVSGTPSPSVRWYKDYLPLDVDGSRVTVDATGTLNIMKSNNSDQGKYHCAAQNRYGVVFSQGANIYVRVRQVPPRFSIAPHKDYNVQLHGDVDIPCVAVGSPMPVVKWQKETRDGPVDFYPAVGTERVIGRIVLPLRNTQESTNYTCVASSTMGTIKLTTEVRVRALPKPPDGLRPYGSGSSAHSLALSWSSGNTEPVTSYTLHCRRRGENVAYNLTTDISSTSYTISGLDPFVEYELRVSAVNPQGEGNKSVALHLRTAEDTPGSPPHDINAYMYGVNTIMVMWAKPLHPNGVIINYTVYYTSDPILPLSEWLTDIVDGNMLLTSLRRLIPSVTYDIRVSAINSVGEGPLSQEVKVKTVQGVPAQPRHFMGKAIDSRRIHLSWLEPNWGVDNIGYEIINYSVFYNCSGAGCSKPKQITIQPSRRQFTLINLEASMVYDIRMVARTVIGKGVFTPTISVRTLSDVPSAPPQKVTAIAANERSLLVKWKGPPKENENGDLTCFTVYYKQNGRKSIISSVRTGPDVNSTLLQGLKPFTTYSVWVSASTEIGEGPNSSVAVATTAESTPDGAPRLMSLEALNSSAIRVRWLSLPSHLTNGNLRGYQIAYALSAFPNAPTRFINAFEGELDGRHSEQVLEYVVDRLQPKTRYSVFVYAFTAKGAGAPSSVNYVTTRGLAPGKPSLYVARKESGMAFVRWSLPQETNGDLVAYILRYRCDDCGVEDRQWRVRRFHHDVTSFSPTAGDDVIPGWTYTFKLAAENVEETGAEETYRIRLPPIPPSHAPRQLSGETVHVTNKLASSSGATDYAIRLKWDPLSRKLSNGPISGYTLYWRESTLTESNYENMTSRDPSYIFTNVAIGEKYQFLVAARNSAGEGPKSPSLILTVSQDRPSNPNITVSDLTVREASSNTIWLQWIPPTDIVQARYLIIYRSSDSEAPMRKEAMASRIAITDLNPSRGYNFTITIFAEEGGKSMQLGSSSIIGRTTPTVITFPPIIQSIAENGSVVVILTQAESGNKVEKYAVIVVPWDESNSPSTSPDTYSHEEVLRNSITMRRRRRRQVSSSLPYITAEFPTIIMQEWFNLGDGKNYGGFVNRPLRSGTSYRIFLRAFRKTKILSFTSTPFSDVIRVPEILFSTDPIFDVFGDPDIFSSQPTPPLAVDGGKAKATTNQLWIIAPIVAVVVIILVILVIICVRRKRGQEKSQVQYSAPVAIHNLNNNKRFDHDPVELRRQNCQTQAMANHPTVPVKKLEAHIDRLRANDNLKFSQEYESIDPGQQFMWEHSLLEVNKSKNRYANVVAYDHTRITLSPVDGVPGSDYINANYISGYRRQNAYIATQGPTPETMADFWRMVWEQRSSVVVMMTKCEERSKVKCEQYWPTMGTESYGQMQVTLVEEVELATYCVRTLALFKSGSSDRREVKQFQFTAWPDHGVPEHPTPVLNFMRRIRAYHQPESGPIVVHCSAGVGRAGCYICIDAMLERIKHEDSIDVYGQVTCMRAERNYMVQTEDQYIFIHDALLEAVNCGNTEIPARSLYSHLQKLTTLEGESAVTGMELEFKRLSNIKASAARFVSANLPCNKFKNRLVNILPFEGTRAYLQPIRGVEGSDYINASFIDGYRQKHAYIATQGPLPETTDDFWRMLWEHNSTIVVMLTKLRESGRDKCHQYWPAERSARYQYFVVDPMSEYSMQQYILREFKVTDARDGQSRTIRQFHFTDWPEQAVPKSGEGFIDFIGQVHKTKEQFGQEGPITIHCSAGVGRSGVFVTLSIALERMRFENVVDMFQTVKILRTQRPAMVQTEDQYQFCYRAALEYLGSFEHYATA